MSKCHECKFRKSIPGNTHISCGLPVFEEASQDPIISLVSMMGGASIPTNLEKPLGMTASEHGIKNGWCFFPFNYDPIWLSGECSEFKKK